MWGINYGRCVCQEIYSNKKKRQQEKKQLYKTHLFQACRFINRFHDDRKNKLR